MSSAPGRSRSLRLLALCAAGVLAAGLSACDSSGDKPNWADGASPAPGVTAPATTTPDFGPSPKSIAGSVITAGGYGPYKVGMALTKAKSDKLIALEESTPACPGWVTGYGVGEFGSIALAFWEGKLLYLAADMDDHKTANGTHVGMKLADVKAKYGSGAKQLTGAAGTKALTARSGADTVLLRFSSAGKLISIEAGTAEALELRFTDGEGC